MALTTAGMTFCPPTAACSISFKALPTSACGRDLLMLCVREGLEGQRRLRLYLNVHRGFRFCDTVLVTETGNIDLTHAPRSLGELTLPVH